MSNKDYKEQIHPINFNYVNGFLVYNDEAAILIDTGRKNTVGNFSDALQELNIEPSRVKLIVLTHTHFDHAGGASSIQELTGAPIAVHRSEAANLEKGYTPYPKGTRWKGKLMVFIGKIFALKMAYYNPVKPDIIIDNELDLSKYGIKGKVVHTPGHTAGSVTVFLNSKYAFAGDNLMGISSKQHFPPFANNPAGVLKAWEKYIASGVEIFYPAHGSQVPVKAIADSLHEAKKRYVK